MLVLSGRSMEAIAKGRPKTTSCSMFEFDSRCGIASATFLPASPSAAKPTPIITQVEGSGTAPPTAGDEVISERERRVRIGAKIEEMGCQPVRTSSTLCRDGFGLSLPLEWRSLSVQPATIWGM